MNSDKKYPVVSVFNPLRLWKYLFKKPVTHPMTDIFTKKNADYLNKNSISGEKFIHLSEI